MVSKMAFEDMNEEAEMFQRRLAELEKYTRKEYE